MNPEYRGQTVCCKIQLEFETLATPPRDRERAPRGWAPHQQGELCPSQAASEKTGSIGGCLPEHESVKEL